MAVDTLSPVPVISEGGRDIGFAVGIVFILTVLFLPIPAFLIDLGLALSIALSVLILMVALWIQRPLDFSAFPTVLLIATMLRLSLNIATTRLILSHGDRGHDAAGYVIGGFSQLRHGRRLRHRPRSSSSSSSPSTSSSSPRARRASPRSARASPSTPFPASRWRSTPISRPA